MNSETIKHLYVRCQCHTPEHHVVFSHHPADKETGGRPELYMTSSFTTTDLSLWERIKAAYLYILKNRSHCYCEILIDPVDAQRIAEACLDFVEGARK